MLLYDSPISGNCYKVRLLFAQLGLSYERHEMDVLDRSARPGVLGHLNPRLTLPTLVLDDGRPLAESNAILWYFAEGTQYLPDDAYERAQVHGWLLFEQTSSMPNIAVMRFWHRWAPEKPGEADMEPKRRAGYAALDAMEAHLASREFFAGDRYSIADISLYGYTHVAEEGSFSLDAYPAVGAWLERVRSQPGHVPMAA